MKFVSEMDPTPNRSSGKDNSLLDTENESIIENYQRNEKIVIYAENHGVAVKIAEQINRIRSKKPELFSSTKTLPFIPKLHGFIGIAENVINKHTNTPLGEASRKII